MTTCALLMWCVFFPLVAAPAESMTRGVIACCGPRANLCRDMTSLHLARAWWYSYWYEPDNWAACAGAEYVPMIWGRDVVTATLTDGGKWLLGFNEPNLPTQSWMTPEEAVSLWPYLEATGRKLVSPATYASPTWNGGSWLADFMALCVGCRVDAISLHFYGCDVGALEAYLALRASEYPGKSLWLTEWGCHGNETAYAAEALPVIERYTARNSAWALYRYEDWMPLVDASGALTPYGAIYAGGMP